jgi:hypothetical protein
MQSEKARDHNDHDHYADDVEDIHVLLRLRFWPAPLRKPRG